MEMQDKEFDKLFSSKFEDFEVEPSKAVWQGITTELGGNNRRKMLPFLSIAASIIVLIAAAVLFIPGRVKPIKEQPVKNQVAANHPKTNPAVIAQPLSIQVQKPVPVVTNQVAAAHPVKKQDIKAHEQEAITPAGKVLNEQPVLASVPQKQDIISHDTISTHTVLAATSVSNIPEKPGISSEELPATDKPTEAAPAKKHRIRSFGDMLNVVIAAVDKRKDKIIEFSNTDGDEASITGVNLGIIKVKKED